MTFLTSLRSEFLKTKRTSVVYLVLIAALVVPFVMVFDHDLPEPGVTGFDHFYREGFQVFAYVFIPFFFILASTLLMQIEVRNNAWKQVLASPQSYFNLLLAKFTVIQVLAVVFLLVFNVYMAAGCLIIDVIYSSDLISYLSHAELLKVNLMAIGSTIGIHALSFWLALRYKNFIAPIAIGILLWLIGPTAALELKWPHFDKYIYVLPFTIMAKKFEDDRLFYQLLSLGYGVLFFTIAYVEFVLQRTSLKTIWKK
jgi:lantibiotic transport system permease protein